MEKSTEERRRLPVTSLFLRIFLIVLVGLTVTLLATRLMEYNRLREEKQQLQLRIEQKQENIDELQYLLDAPVDREYIIRVAREKLGLNFPDEIVYYNDLNK